MYQSSYKDEASHMTTDNYLNLLAKRSSIRRYEGMLESAINYGASDDAIQSMQNTIATMKMELYEAEGSARRVR